MAGAVAVLMAIVAGSAATTRAPVILTWTAPEGCPSEDQIRAEVRRMAGASAGAAETTEAHAMVRREHEGGWQLTLTTRVGALQGERKLSASDCAELGRAAALVIALMINPTADPAAPPVAPATVPVPVWEPSPQPAPSAGPFALDVHLLGGSGELPGGSAGLGARFAVARGPASLQLAADLWLPRDAPSPAKPSAGGSFGAADLSLAGCLTARRNRRLAPGACAGPALTRMHAIGSGASDPGAATALSPGGFLEGNLRVRFTARNALRLGIEALLPLARPTFALAGIGTVFRPSAFWPRASLGWELNF